jgi:3-oxoacyl-[acyl-carrier protein] reductase
VTVRVGIVTGAARGIGAAIAERLAADGLAVCVADLDGAAAERQTERIATQGGVALACQMDVTLPVERRRSPGFSHGDSRAPLGRRNPLQAEHLCYIVVVHFHN